MKPHQASSEKARRNHMNDEPLTTIEREVKSWPGVTTGDTGRGGLQFSYGRVELGHLHGSSFADLPFPKKVRDELIAQGRASVHPPLPESGWVRRRMDSPEDTEAVIELFRMNYNRAKERAGRSSARQG
jgi:Family of unknown function (DUF5519)